MKKFAKAMFISAMAISVLSLISAIVSIICRRDVLKLLSPEDFTKIKFTTFIPYFYCIVLALEVLLSVITVFVVSKHFRENSSNIVCEIIAMVYGAFLRGIIVRVGTTLCNFRTISNNQIQSADAVTATANSLLLNLFGVIIGIANVGISLLLIGCGVSVAVKNMTAKGR